MSGDSTKLTIDLHLLNSKMDIRKAVEQILALIEGGDMDGSLKSGPLDYTFKVTRNDGTFCGR